MKINLKILVTLVIVAAIALTACGKSTSKEIDLDTLSTAIIEQGDFGDELIALPERIASDYYAVPFDGLEDYRIYISATSASASEFAVFKLKDKAAVDSAKSVIEKRIATQVGNYENYRPEEKFRLDNALVATNGNYLFFSVSNNNSDLEKVFENSFK